jgi:UDP-2,3-diacylglucosamine pyrophosphatase LpxH
MRNPVINGTAFIGDPHLGRVFVNDIGLDKRGVLEKRQRKTFHSLLWAASKRGCARIVIVGDLFDKFVVKEETLHWVMITLHEFVSETYGHYPIYIMQGNHDTSKNSAVKSSFDLLELWATTAHPKAIHCVRTITVVDDLMLIPWRHDKTAIQQINEIKEEFTIPSTAVTHLDRIGYGINEDNLIPFEELKALGVTRIINGHEHKPVIDGLLYCIGSMRPYSHAEVLSNEQDYVTLTQAQIEEPDFDLEKYAGSMVRVIVDKNFAVPEIKSVGLKVIKVNSEVDATKLDVEYISESLNSLFHKCMAEVGVTAERSAEVWTTLDSFKQSDL